MADELQVRVTITRKSSTDHDSADHVIGDVTSAMNSADRERFLAFLGATYGIDENGDPRTMEGIVEAFWSSIVAGTVSNIERWEKDAAAAAARDAVTPVTVANL